MNRFLSLTVLLFFSLVATSFAANPSKEDMVLIPGGCFMMGTDKTFYYEHDSTNVREKPSHKVCLDPFYLDKYEVSQEKWEKAMEYNHSVYQQPDLPVNQIKWEEAQLYCEKKSYRLPTEAEWEYAALAGSKDENPWGDGIQGDYLWYMDNSFRKQHPVGTKKPNAWGVYNMMGSVWEWVADWYSEKYYQESPTKNPKGPLTPKSFRVIRGASWVSEESLIRVTVREKGLADGTLDYWVGFRCAFTPPI